MPEPILPTLGESLSEEDFLLLERELGSSPSSRPLTHPVIHHKSLDPIFKDLKHPSYFSSCERDKEGHCLPSGMTEGGTPQKQRAEKGKLVAAKREGKGKDARVVIRGGSPAPAHIKPAMIPPAWKNVRISLDPDADVLVQGRDTKGRSVTVYHEKYLANNQAAKFAKIQEGLTKFQDIFNQNQQNRNSKDPAIREAADCMWLMQEQATRPGNEGDSKGFADLYGKKMTKDNVQVSYTKKGKSSVALLFGDKKVPIRDEGTKNEIIRRINEGRDLLDSTFWLKSHGATTLESRHVVEATDGVHLQFVGKEGIWHDHLIRDKGLAGMLLKRKNREGKLFDVDYPTISKYSRTLDGGQFSPKDFRTMKATSLAINEINKQKDCCASADEYKRSVMQVAEKVSNVLGNRPAQALESYIAPEIFSVWRNKEMANA